MSNVDDQVPEFEDTERRDEYVGRFTVLGVLVARGYLPRTVSYYARHAFCGLSFASDTLKLWEREFPDHVTREFDGTIVRIGWNKGGTPDDEDEGGPYCAVCGDAFNDYEHSIHDGLAVPVCADCSVSVFKRTVYKDLHCTDCGIKGVTKGKDNYVLMERAFYCADCEKGLTS